MYEAAQKTDTVVYHSESNGVADKSQNKDVRAVQGNIFKTAVL